MDLPWGDDKTVQFITNVGLITSDGPVGQNIMSAEWTHHVSYSPGMIAVCLGLKKATLENIRATKQFGVNICALDQGTLASVAGGSTGREINKIEVLKELGFEFYKAKKIETLMVKGAALNAECKLVEEKLLGDHVMLVGEVVEASHDGSKEPLAYHKGKYWRLDTNVPKPADEEREKIGQIVEKHRKVKEAK